MEQKSVRMFKEQKIGVIKVIVFSIILAIAINVFTEGFCDVLDFSPFTYTIVGLLVSLLITFLSCVYITHSMKSNIEFKGAFIVNQKKANKLCLIPNYSISEDMVRFLRAAQKENAAIEKQWGNIMFTATRDEREERKKTFGIVNELLEYCVLNNLSTFVCDYFNKLDATNKVEKIVKNNIPEVLLSNRFLRLFSEEIANRIAFGENNSCIVSIDDDGNEEVVLMRGENGEIYENFRLYMPSGTKIQRKEKSIVVDTKLFVIEITSEFEGFNTVFDRTFEEFYIGMDYSGQEYTTYQFSVKLDIKYKKLSMFKFREWKEYNWFDDYVIRLQHYCDKQTFLRDIDWKKQDASLRLLHHFLKKVQKTSKKEEV